VSDGFFSSKIDSPQLIRQAVISKHAGWEARVPHRPDACVPIRVIRVIRG
jgi:hypothetical protein